MYQKQASWVLRLPLGRGFKEALSGGIPQGQKTKDPFP